MAEQRKLKVLDLFSGIGGFSLGLERTGGFETAAFCEIEAFPRKVLKKHWPDVPCFEDIRYLKGDQVGAVDVICGGYPCQPFSTAGKRQGQKDDRHLWPEFSRLVAELRPSWVIGENVAGHISMGLDDVLSDLEGQGYACRTFIIPACAVDAPHRRDRCWTVGHADGAERREVRGSCDRLEIEQDGISQWAEGSGRFEGGGEDVADANRTNAQGWKETGNPSGIGQRGDKQSQRCCDYPRSAWLPEPRVGRVVDGISGRVDRLKTLGNAVVPQIPEMIGRAILMAELETKRGETQ